MLVVFKNWGVLVLWLIAALLPTLLIFYAHSVAKKWKILSVIWWAFIFTLWRVSFAWAWPYGFWFFKILLYILLFFWLIAVFVAISTILWWYIKHLIFKSESSTITHAFLDFWLWLVIGLLLIYILLLLNIFYPIITWALFVWWILFVYKSKEYRKRYESIISEFFSHWKILLSEGTSLRKTLWVILLFIVILLWFRYLYNWYVLSFMPYPTAWDANHAYMF